MYRKLSGSMIAVALALTTGVGTTYATHNSKTIGGKTVGVHSTLVRDSTHTATVTTESLTTKSLTTTRTVLAATAETRNTLGHKQTSEEMSYLTSNAAPDANTTTKATATAKGPGWVDVKLQTG
jgi:hypothetical protein